MKGFLELIENSQTAFHACSYFEVLLQGQGYIKLKENEIWDLKQGGKYYISRNSSSLVAFTVPYEFKKLSYNIVATHTDSPTFKLKPNFELVKGRYGMLNTEVYGGPILNTWLDRPLGIAGRIIVKTNEGLETKLVCFYKPMAIIPNCSIHYYHELNKGVALNPQNELVPLLYDNKNAKVDLLEMVANEFKDIKKEDIVSHDLYLYVMDRGGLVGANEEFLTAPQIDNLECSYAAVKALLNSKSNSSVNVAVLFDNEEIGSRTRQGAASKLLSDTLERISECLGLTPTMHKIALNNSFIVSADNAQGFHPNYAHKFDPTNAVFLNDGIVIKTAARGSYTTDAVSQAYFKTICERANAKYQVNTNRSDVPGGSTLGCISLSQVSIHSVDIGLPQVAMHSAMETAGAKDLEEMIKALTEFYSTHLEVTMDGQLKF